MSHKIKTVYVVHHSHTDIGYTDLQERVIAGHVRYIRMALEQMRRPQWKDFRWNCETWFCVEEFLKRASPEEKEEFFARMRQEQMVFSATYLNFTDLADCSALSAVMDRMCRILDEQGIPHATAMCADINGISMGQRDVLLEHGVEFLYTNIHTHHGMYTLYQNQNAYWWENAEGKRLLVWNGEHYHLGNALGLIPGYTASIMEEDLFGVRPAGCDTVDLLHRHLEQYLDACENDGYPYDFIITSVSGVYSDNAPPETAVLENIRAYHERYGRVKLKMVSLQELYREILPRLKDLPVYRGDLTDWWAHGIGSTPYAVKHYRDAQRRYQLCTRLDAHAQERYPEEMQAAEENLLMYAEHTWGHSMATIRPYDSMVLHLDTRKTSYASKAHEAASRVLSAIGEEYGDILCYYSNTGRIRVIPASHVSGPQVVEFYVECSGMENVCLTREDGRKMVCQISGHPRGRRITFVDSFEPGKPWEYLYQAVPAQQIQQNCRHAYVGIERVKDILNTYEPQSCMMPYEFENRWFRLCYRPGEGITHFIHKPSGREMLETGSLAPFFTPIYERTAVRPNETCEQICMEKRERRDLGRNIRGLHAQQDIARLTDVRLQERGAVFSTLELRYSLQGTIHCRVILKLFEEVPRIDFKLELGKTICRDIESIFLPLSLNLEDGQEIWLEKGREPFRPGIDQIPGSCMEYYVSDSGLAIVGGKSSLLLSCPDVPLLYMGEMRHHPIRLCGGRMEDNRRPVYSWVMNNVWETNFKTDLSGFGEYDYSLYLSEASQPQQAMDELKERSFHPYTVIIG